MNTPDGEANGQVLRALYAAIIAHDFDTFGEHLLDDAELNIEGLPDMSGTWRGRDAALEAARQNSGRFTIKSPGRNSNRSWGAKCSLTRTAEAPEPY